MGLLAFLKQGARTTKSVMSMSRVVTLYVCRTARDKSRRRSDGDRGQGCLPQLNLGEVRILPSIKL